MSLFSQTKKYGMNLARFFPAILCLKKWQMSSQIHLRRRGIKFLELNSSQNLLPPYRHFIAYIPEEIEMFKKLFADKQADEKAEQQQFFDDEFFKKNNFGNWQIFEPENFIQFSGEGADTYCFPDFVFRNASKNASGAEIALEIFHNWHSNILIKRLSQLKTEFQQKKSPKLIIAVATKLAKDKKIAKYLTDSKYFQNFGFTFHSMPTHKQTINCLNNAVNFSK